MFITCIMIRLFYNQKNFAKTIKNHTNNLVTTNKINKYQNAFSIIKKYTAHGCGCYGRLSHSEKNYLFFSSCDNLP